MATWYGARAQGRPTANGERFDRNALTAAHRTLPLNSRVRVVNLDNGQSVVVRITDRGPQAWTHRDIDLSEAAAREIGMLRSGVAHVRIEPL
jgi:rare lipoprotein A